MKRPSSPPPRPRRPDELSYPGAASFFSGATPSVSSTSPVHYYQTASPSLYAPYAGPAAIRSQSPGFKNPFDRASHDDTNSASAGYFRPRPFAQSSHVLNVGRTFDQRPSPFYEGAATSPVGYLERFPRALTPTSLSRVRSPVMRDISPPSRVPPFSVFNADARLGQNVSPVRQSSPLHIGNRAATWADPPYQYDHRSAATQSSNSRDSTSFSNGREQFDFTAPWEPSMRVKDMSFPSRVNESFDRALGGREDIFSKGAMEALDRNSGGREDIFSNRFTETLDRVSGGRGGREDIFPKGAMETLDRDSGGREDIFSNRFIETLDRASGGREDIASLLLRDLAGPSSTSRFNAFDRATSRREGATPPILGEMSFPNRFNTFDRSSQARENATPPFLRDSSPPSRSDVSDYRSNGRTGPMPTFSRDMSPFTRSNAFDRSPNGREVVVPSQSGGYPSPTYLSTFDAVPPGKDGVLQPFSRGELSSNTFDDASIVRDGVAPTYASMSAANGDLIDRSSPSRSNRLNPMLSRRADTIPPFMQNGDGAENSMSSSGRLNTLNNVSSNRIPRFMQNGNVAEKSMSYVEPTRSYASNHQFPSTKTVETQTTLDLPLESSSRAVNATASSLSRLPHHATFADTEEDSDCEDELREEPKQCRTGRRFAFSSEVYGVFNQRKPYTAPKCSQTVAQNSFLLKSLQDCVFFQSQDLDVIEHVAAAMEIETKENGACILRQGEHGRSAYILIEGLLDIYDEPPVSNSTSRLDSTGCLNGSAPASRTYIRNLEPGRFFGEMTMLWGVPRSKSVYANGTCLLGKLKREAYMNLVVQREISERSQREDKLRRVKMFETFNEEQVSSLADALEKRTFEKDQPIVKQGEDGTEFFVVLCGECVIEVATGTDMDNLDVQEYGRYQAGDLFGELALKNNAKRSATIRAVTYVEVLALSREKFERMLGKLDNLQQANYLHDPRKCIADFFGPGGQNGPQGMSRLSQNGTLDVQDGEKTSWFAVYRPTSRDAIAKMLSGSAVGKGLNVKGKSAKKNRLSGFVPFLQISKNDDKKEIEESPADARLAIYYSSEGGRQTALLELEKVMQESSDIAIDNRRIWSLDGYKGIWGLDLPEPLMKEAYIMRQDISELSGWETGRKSEPAFMDMNLHAVRGNSEPKVVLYQHDTDNVMNPRGLLIAYAEEHVKPVVSDFDTFTVGSRGMSYAKLPAEQQSLANWSLDRTREILDKTLESPTSTSWTSLWLEVIKIAHEQGFHPEVPKYGFGDATSVILTEGVCKSTIDSGAVRHGAECFNFFFPQELDDEYLIVWEGFPDKPWEYKSEDELRAFLRDRIKQGFCFPLNPVWMVRDPGWYDVLKDLRASESAIGPLNSWFPAESRLLDKIETIHKKFPDGFQPILEEVERGRINSYVPNDLEGCERAELATFKASKKAQEHANRFMMMLSRPHHIVDTGKFDAIAMWQKGAHQIIKDKRENAAGS